jgi:hypothetical protein
VVVTVYLIDPSDGSVTPGGTEIVGFVFTGAMDTVSVSLALPPRPSPTVR